MKMKIGAGLSVSVRGEGPSLIWAHGLTASIAAEDAFDWFQWSDFPQSLRCIRYDARGHGDSNSSDRPEDYQWPQLGRDLLSVADALGVERFVAGGASMGCASALYAAFAAPKRLQGLVLAIPPTAWESRTAQSAAYRRTARVGGLVGGALLARMVRKRPSSMLPPWLIAADPDKTAAGITAGLGRMSGKTLRNLFLGAAQSNLPAREAFSQIAHLPALILAWAGDGAHPISTAETLHQLLPRSTLFVAEDLAGLRSFAARQREFVARHAGGPLD